MKSGVHLLEFTALVKQLVLKSGVHLLEFTALVKQLVLKFAFVEELGFLMRIDFTDTHTARIYLCKLTASTVRMPHSINDVCRSDLQQLTKEWNKCILRQKRSASEIFGAHNIRILTIRGNFLS